MPRLLVVDDEKDVREILADLLRVDGYEVFTAADGADALALLRRQAVELILLDLSMPNVDGYDLRREQLADPSLATIPVVIMTGSHRADAVAATLSVSDFLQKPIEMSKLRQLAKRYCGR